MDRPKCKRQNIFIIFTRPELQLSEVTTVSCRIYPTLALKGLITHLPPLTFCFRHRNDFMWRYFTSDTYKGLIRISYRRILKGEMTRNLKPKIRITKIKISFGSLSLLGFWTLCKYVPEKYITLFVLTL